MFSVLGFRFFEEFQGFRVFAFYVYGFLVFTFYGLDFVGLLVFRAFKVCGFQGSGFSGLAFWCSKVRGVLGVFRFRGFGGF